MQFHIHPVSPSKISPLRQAIFAIFSFVFIVSSDSLHGAVFQPTPHDEHHVIPLSPSDFVNSAGMPPKTVADPNGAFDLTTHVLTEPLTSELKVRHNGRYTLWVRIAQTRNRPYPVKIQITGKNGTVLSGLVNHNDNAQLARHAYGEQAKKNTPAGSVASFDSNRFALAPDKKKIASTGDDITGELLGELREKPSDPWVGLARVEEIVDDSPFYWWKVGFADLAPGRYQMRVELANPPAAKATHIPKFDAAFLTTNDKLVYPYFRDIGKSRATYVRFRLDRLPKSGIRITGAFQTHVLQHPRLSTVFGIDNLDKEGTHTKTGFTAWYRLQDIEFMPAAGPREIGMRLSIFEGTSHIKEATGFAGVTQFASFPHMDYVVREFDWTEPAGLNYTVPLECATYRHRLMTFRDHAREHYETALAATERLNPLTRGELFFTGICGSLNADDRDYMVKTMRLLGFNSIAEAGDPLPGRKQYGWNGAQFAATLPLSHPVNEEKSRLEYEDYFRKMFADPKIRETWKDSKTYCISDEPGEAYRIQMTAPVWQFRETEKGETYLYDPIGSSEIYTRHDTLGDCVVEGVAEHGRAGLQFHVGVDDPQHPSRYWFWRLGYPIGPALNANLAFGQYDSSQPPKQPTYRMVQALGNTQGKLRFKIVQQGDTATFFINGVTIHQHLKLPKITRFGIGGGIKQIYQLRLRPLQPGEGVSFQEGDLQAGTKRPTPDLGLKELGLDNLPPWAKPKSLRQAFEEDWVAAGGEPVVREAFRKWAQHQGLTPDSFGKKEWQQVQPITLPFLVQNEDDAKAFYWSRRYSGQLTPKRFTMMSDAISKFAPNPKMWNYPALSGGVLYRAKEMPVDMFALASHGKNHTGGISDWMFYSSWRWDSHQAVAYSAELFNAGARRHGQQPVSFPMMHCVHPTVFRAYTQIANQVKLLSCYSYGPNYLNFPDSWSEKADCYSAVSSIANRAAMCDDILSPGLRRPSRVALLYAHSTEYWNPKSSFDDKRSTFLGLSHDYFQPEVVSEQQILDGSLQHYDALYVLEPNVAADVQTRIGQWVQSGGLMWACADAVTRDEFNRPTDLLEKLVDLRRVSGKTTSTAAKGPLVSPVQNGPKFRPHSVLTTGMPESVSCGDADIQARYEDGAPAWLEKAAGKGRVVYIPHRAGSTYASRNVLSNGYKEVWTSTGRELLTQPLFAANVNRELVLSEPAIMATPTSTDAGTVIILYNMWPTPRRETIVRIREPRAPHSVEAFSGLSLQSVPFEYRDGWVSVTLKDWTEGQMLVVRRQPKPADERFEKMRQRTLEQLSSKDADALSAGVWFAGFYPDWNVADKIASLINHPAWSVRRSAAEAIGRLGQTSEAAALIAAVQHEKDPHVLGTQLLALAELRHPASAELCLKQLSHQNFSVRHDAIRGLRSLLIQQRKSPTTTLDDNLAKTLQSGVETALLDDDQRVRRDAIHIFAQLDGSRALERALIVFQDRDPQAKMDQAIWAESLGASDVNFDNADLLKKMNEDFILAISKHRNGEHLARALVGIATHTATKDSLAPWVAAMLNQRDVAAAKTLFDSRTALPAGVRSYLPLIWEHTFNASLGNDEADWEDFFAKR